jgi:hypothetical protein
MGKQAKSLLHSSTLVERFEGDGFIGARTMPCRPVLFEKSQA